MAISARYQGQTPPESTRTEKAPKQPSTSESESESTAAGTKRNRTGQKGCETSDSESDSLQAQKKSRSAENPEKLQEKADQVTELDEDVASGEVGDSAAAEAIELSEEVVAAAKRGNLGKRRAQAGSDGDKGPEPEDNESEDDSELDLPEETITKAKSTADPRLLTIFSLQVAVAFKSKGKDGSISTTTKKGRWCKICKKDPKKKAISGRRAGWYVGENLSCHRHIVSMHYSMYVAQCKAAGIWKETEQVTARMVHIS